jgi:hypothetical protein
VARANAGLEERVSESPPTASTWSMAWMIMVPLQPP